MTTVTVKYPPRDFTPLIEYSTLPDVPHRAHWWRVRILPSADGVAYVTDIDGLDALLADPTSEATCTYRWVDGTEDAATPYAARITTEPEEPLFLGRDTTICAPSRVTAWVDVLDIEAPTSNPMWEPLTQPGDHRHPGDLRAIAQLRSERGLLPLWTIRGLGGIEP